MCRIRDLVGPEWFSSDCYRWFLREGLDCTDGLRIGIAVGQDVEAGFTMHRDAARPAFTRKDCDLAACAGFSVSS